MTNYYRNQVDRDTDAVAAFTFYAGAGRARAGRKQLEDESAWTSTR